MAKLTYQREALEELYRRLPPARRDEMALPSYLHRNPLIRWLVARRINVVLDLLDFRPGQSVLDFGCGAGMLLLQLPPGGGFYYGVDLLIWPAQQFLAAHGRGDPVLLEAAGWPQQVPAGGLDSIVALEVLEHVEDVPEVLRLFRRKLKPEGRLIVSGPTENFLYQLGRRIAGFSGEYHHRDIFEIVGDVEGAGFSPEKQVRLPLPGPLALFLIGVYRPVRAAPPGSPDTG
ncbi:MAG: class I SAM-dependent methyltransferase [Anaerolineae bacterium]